MPAAFAAPGLGGRAGWGAAELDVFKAKKHRRE